MAWVQSGLRRVDEVSESATIKIRNHDAMNTLRAAQDALYTLARRGLTSRFIVRGDELTAMNLAMEVHDAQLETVTVKQLEAALDFVNETVRLKKARSIVETV